MFLTNKRLFFLDADLDRVPSLQESKDVGGMVLHKLKVVYEVTDDIWYYPMPLTNLKGMSLDIHFTTLATGWIHEKRPWWSVIISLAGFALLGYALYQHYQLSTTDMQQLIGGGITSFIGPMLFLFLKVYSRSPFQPVQKQERKVTLGAKDPITQQHAIYQLFLDDQYTIVEAKNVSAALSWLFHPYHDS